MSCVPARVLTLAIALLLSTGSQAQAQDLMDLLPQPSAEAPAAPLSWQYVGYTDEMTDVSWRRAFLLSRNTLSDGQGAELTLSTSSSGIRFLGLRLPPGQGFRCGVRDCPILIRVGNEPAFAVKAWAATRDPGTWRDSALLADEQMPRIFAGMMAGQPLRIRFERLGAGYEDTLVFESALPLESGMAPPSFPRRKRRAD